MAATQTTATSTTLPAPGTYAVDASHSSVDFSVRHLMVSKVRGSFQVPSGTIVIGDNPFDSSVVATIDAASVHTRDAKRDEHLRSADFFHTDEHPTVEFRSTRVGDVGEAFTLYGDLTIKGVTRPVVLDVEFLGSGPSPFGDERIGFSASTEVNRKDWGLDFNMALETGGVVVGDKIKLTIDVEAIKQ